MGKPITRLTWGLFTSWRPSVFFKDLQTWLRRLFFLLKYGYCPQARWEIFEWHRQVMSELLANFREHHCGVPFLIEDESEDMSKNEETSNNIIEQMSLAMNEMGDDNEDYRARNHAKMRFFRLFSEYYFCLWD